MNRYNQMPENAVRISNYEDFSEFFHYCLETESRQIFMDANNYLSPTMHARLYWINTVQILGESHRIGYMVIQNDVLHQIEWYKIGTSDEWNKFHSGFGAQFQGDNS